MRERVMLPPGPWSKEPDKIEWRDKETGRPCLIVRGSMGALCGYTGVYEGHPLFQKGYSECMEPGRHRRKTRKELRRAQLFEQKKARKADAANPESGGASWRKSMRDLNSRYSRASKTFLGRKKWCSHIKPESLLEVHGGVTYAGHCSGEICHVPRPGEKRVWWFGFDCSHHMDLTPGLLEYGGSTREGTYRDVAYVKAEVARLAGQLSALRKKA